MTAPPPRSGFTHSDRGRTIIYLHRLGRLTVSPAFLAVRLCQRIIPETLRSRVPNTVRGIGRVGSIARSLEATWRHHKPEFKNFWDYKLRLRELGHVEQTLEDLKRTLEDPKITAYDRQRTSWLLAVWYANLSSEEDATAALVLLDRMLDEDASSDEMRQRAVLRAECLAKLGDIDAAREVITSALRAERHADLHLAAANLHEEPSERLSHVNEALRSYNLPEVCLGPESGDSLYDRLKVNTKLERVEGPKVSVIVPAFNAAEHVATAMEALIAQTWTNFEVLVVDDLSTDTTPEIVSGFSERDPRIRLIRSQTNCGSYVARNIALREADGEFVTTHDADDWSHPLKLEIQARHLMENPDVIANMSRQARATPELTFYRRGNPGFYIFDNMSSLMFRREPATAKLGFWDSVRFAADSEFIARLRLTFGEESAPNLPDAGPLSFQRQLKTSLTGGSASGYPGFLMGARQAYHRSSRRYHQVTKNLVYEFPQARRPFAVPEPMRPDREVAKGERRVFDVILVSDFRISGAILKRNLAQIKKERLQRHRIGLIQLAHYDFDPRSQIQPEIQELEDRGNVDIIVFGEHVSCERLIVLNAPLLEDFQCFIPDVLAKKVQVCFRRSEITDMNSDELNDWINKCKENAKRYFGSSGDWTFKN